MVSRDGQVGAAAVSAQAGVDVCRRCGRGKLVQRTDDNEHVVRERVKVYERETQPVLDFYRLRPTFRIVNGAQPPDRVASELEAAVDSLLRVSERSTVRAPVEPRR